MTLKVKTLTRTYPGKVEDMHGAIIAPGEPCELTEDQTIRMESRFGLDASSRPRATERKSGRPDETGTGATAK